MQKGTFYMQPVSIHDSLSLLERMETTSSASIPGIGHPVHRDE